MHQPSLYEVLSGGSTQHTSQMPEVYDFFAGAGGFSEGARQAGCKVVWVCDNNELALETHAKNHPDAVHCLAELPMQKQDLPFPTDGRPYHVHFSPPCQKFSPVNQRKRNKGDETHAVDLVTWSLQTALSSGATSWSLEQVASSTVISLVAAARARCPGRVEYAKIDFAEMGVPQRRVRVIAGSPALIAYVMRQRSASKVCSAQRAISKPRGTHLRNGKGWIQRSRGLGGKLKVVKADWGDHCTAISKPAPTVLADRGMNWVTKNRDGSVGNHPRLRMHEYAALQTFPPTYQWPDTEQLALKHIGNAVPPLVAKVIMGWRKEERG
jgi:DNA (cytosine-5)-methyltransferase 1